MFRKKNRSKKRTRAMLSAYSIIMILIILLGILSHVLPKAKYSVVMPEEESAVEVGPGEWEGEVPANASEELVLPEGETVEPEVGAEGVLIDEAPAQHDAVIALPVEAPEVKTYESKEACEEENGEGTCAIVNGSGVVGAELYQVLIAPILGFESAIDVCIFVMVLGGFLAVMAKTKALETGIKILVNK